MAQRYTIRGIVKQSLPVLVGVTIVSMFTGVSFEHIFTSIFALIPVIVIILPGFIHLVGDISDVFSARLSTMLFKGDIDYNFKPFKLYFLNSGAIISVAATGFLFISIIGNILSTFVFGETAPWLKFIFIVMLSGLISVFLLIIVVSLLTRYVLLKQMDPDNIVPPITTTFGDLIATVLLIFFTQKWLI